MSILSEADKPIYFPDVTLTGDALMGAIRSAQAIAESNIGASRPLELQQYTEVRTINSARALLTRLPIDPTATLILSARSGGYRDVLGRSIPKSAWFPFQISDFKIDFDIGEIFTLAPQITEIRATYTTGFDFTLDTPDVKRIKSAVAEVLNYQQSNSYQGLLEVSVEGEYKVRYGSSSGGAGTIPDLLLVPFRKYRPRSFC